MKEHDIKELVHWNKQFERNKFLINASHDQPQWYVYVSRQCVFAIRKELPTSSRHAVQ